MKISDIFNKAHSYIEAEKMVPILSAVHGRKISPLQKMIFALTFFILLLTTVVTSSFAGTFVVFDSHDIIRSTGAPVDEVFDFDVLDPTAKYEIHITIGDVEVTSADLVVNEEVLASAKYFNAKTQEIIKSFTIGQKKNRFLARLAGKVGSHLRTRIIGHDDVAPEITATITPAANENSWNNTTVVVSFTCYDKTSGIKTCPEPITVDLEGANQVVSGTAIDKAGNETTTSVTINLDKTAGTIASSIVPAPNSSGWNNTDLAINFICEDTLSGVASCSPTKQVTIEGALQTFTGNVVDLASNEASTTVTIKLDKTLPIITATAEPAANIRNWNNSSVNLIYSCSDSLSGVSTCATNNLVGTEGQAQDIIASALDIAGNTGNVTTTINIDLTVPNISSSVLPLPNTAGWHNTDPTVSFTCTDNLSGILTCPSAVIHSVEGGNQQVTGTAVDNADNANELSTLIKLDKTIPTITTAVTPVANANGWHNTDATVSFTCVDSISGIASCALPILASVEAASQTLTGKAIDVADNEATASVTIKLDKTAPNLFLSVLPLANAAGWHNTDPTVSFTCTDNLSGIQTCPSTVIHSVEGGNQQVTGTAIDNAGNTDELSTTIKLDKTIPTITAAVAPVANANGWHNADATVSFTCVDSISGIASCALPVVASLEAASQTLTGKAVDIADNEATTSVAIKLDKTAPTITATITPVANAAGWHNGTAIVSFTCNDALSGIESCSTPVTVSLESATNVVTGTAVDKAGNSTDTSVTVKIDLTAPVIDTNVVPAANTNGWHNTDPTVNFVCNDVLSGVASCQAPIAVTAESANQTLTGSGVDNAGNSASTTATIKLDKTAPTISATIAPVANPAGWHNGTAIVSFSCNDTLSGIQSCTAPITVSLESAANLITGTVVDKAGNTTETSVTIKTDLTAPVINTNVIPAANTNGWHKADPTVNFICSDVLSGVASCNAPVTVTTEAASQTVSGSATDAADNTATTSTIIKLDKTAPTITTQLTPVANAGGWHNGDVVVSFTCNDLLSGIETCPLPVTISTEGQNQLVSGTAIDKAGNTATASVAVNTDYSVPNIDTTITPTPNANGWNNVDTTISYICSDSLSGVQSCPADNILTTEGLAQLISASATDIAGNTANTSNLVNIDKTAPTITSSVEPAANSAGWNNTTVVVSFICNDTLSGIETCPAQIMVDLEAANKVITGTAVDKAGNSASTSVTLNIDKTPALINASIAPLANAAGWNNTDVTVSFTCSDSLSNVASCSPDQILTTEAANQVVTGNAVDIAGNISSTSISIDIDKTLPSINSSITPTANANGWFNSNPTISYTCTDALSGIANCAATQTITLEAAAQVVSGSALDVAGNTASVSDTINLDKTAPQITATVAPVANASGWNNSTVFVAFSCTDSLSGIDSCTAPVTVDLDTASQVVTGTATDKAGNSSETSVTIKLDKTIPLITIAPSQPANANGWFNADTTLTATCSDTLSGIATCPAAQAITNEGAGQPIEMTATDIAGNSAIASITMNVDKTIPVISAELTPAANANGWNNSDVTVTHVCNDTLSGIASCTDVQTITTEGADQIITGTAVDLAGNSVSSSSSLNIDKTAPQLSFVTPANNGVETQNPPTLTLALTDNLSVDNTSLEIVVNGLLVTPQCQFTTGQVVCNLTTAINDVAATISAQISDLAGNSTTATSSFAFDSDADGVIDANDAFPQDPNESADLDGDGIGDNSDTDRDGDGFSNDQETLTGFDPNDSTSTPPDLDGDFIPDSLDTDRDGDGVANDVDAFPDNAAESSDLDGDGIGDNADDDRDGDGFSNVDEIAAGSNPDDATDFPDTTAPVVTLNGTTTRTTELDLVDLTGTVSDSGSGVATVVITSDRYAGLSFDAVITANQWAASVPVEIGSNQINIVATDNSNNTANIAVSVERTVANLEVGLTIDYPTPNLTVTNPDIVIRGQLRSNKPALQKTITVNGVAATLTATSQVTEFNFESQTVTLVEGINSIAVQANIDGQSLQKSVLVTYQKVQQQVAAPVIAVLSPSAGSYQTGTSITLAGRVTTTAGLKSLTINNQAVAFSSSSAPDYNFQDILSFATGSSQLDAVIVATDELDQVTQQTVSYYRDQTAPVIQLQQSLLGNSEINVVREQPYTLSGTITDANLASFFINNTQMGLTPLGNGVFSFELPITLGQLTPMDLVLSASDQAGNQTTQSYILQLDGSVTVSILRPETNTEILSSGTANALAVTARIEGNAIPQGITSTATLLDNAGQSVSTGPLAISADLASGEVSVPAVAGDYTLVVQVLDANNAVLSSSQTTIKVIDAAAIELELVRTEPADSEKGVEPNSSITIYFNKAIDITKLTLNVHETAHGQTYVDLDELGTSGINSKGYQLVEVNRDYQPVTGTVSILPNNQGVAFYPTVDFAYNGTIFVDVVYDGQELLRSQFNTRSLPTFITGFVVDQLNQRIPGIEVSIPALSRTTKTNSDGAYSFGYGDKYNNALPNGSHELIFNKGMKNPLFGTQSLTVNIQKHNKNNLPSVTVPILNRELPFVQAKGGQSLNLLQGALKIDLTAANLQFPDGRRQGDIHAQVFKYSQITYPVDTVAVPLFAYSIQPAGVAVEGNVSIDMSIPTLNGRYDHVPDDGILVLLVGLSREYGQIVPVGVGEIQNKRVLSRGKVNLQHLDYIGYGLAQLKAQPVMQQYINGEISLQELVVEVRRLQVETQ